MKNKSENREVEFDEPPSNVGQLKKPSGVVYPCKPMGRAENPIRDIGCYRVFSLLLRKG